MIYIYIILNLCCLNKYFSYEDDDEDCCCCKWCEDCCKEKGKEDINKNYTPIKIDIQKIREIILKNFFEEKDNKNIKNQDSQDLNENNNTDPFVLDEQHQNDKKDNKNIKNQDSQDLNENNNTDPFVLNEQPQNDKDNNILYRQELYEEKIKNIIYHLANFYYIKKDVIFLFKIGMTKSRDGKIVFKTQHEFYNKSKSVNVYEEDKDLFETIHDSEEQLKNNLYERIKTSLPEDIIVINEEEKKLP